MEQAEYLKSIIQEKDNQIAILEKQLLDDLQIIKIFQQKVENLESINRNNKRYIEFQEQEMDLKIKKEKNKRFGIGIVSGYGYNQELKQNAFVGIGLSYNLIRF